MPLKRIPLKKLTKIIVMLIGLYLLYAFASGVLFFHFHQHEVTDDEQAHQPQRFWGDDDISQDRTVLIEDRYDSWLARINLIENAQHSLDISYHSVHPGSATNIYFGALIEAADRGVHVRLLLDGIFHNLRGQSKGILYALADHPQIELKFYEPLDLLRPWTWNNRLHDKIMIVDEEKAMIGGRNLGDRYYAPEGFVGAANDRDVLIINTDEQRPANERHSTEAYQHTDEYHPIDEKHSTDEKPAGNSVIEEFKHYFHTVWAHPFSEQPLPHPTQRQQEQGQETTHDLYDNLQAAKEEHPDMFDHSINWIDQSLPTNNITLIHNPLQRGNKEPWIWYELTNLMEKAEESIFMQSPYVIPTDQMLAHIDEKNITADMTLLTNSMASTPNVLAYSGYLNYREELVDRGINVYEYQNPDESIHAKTFVFDKQITAIGSFNLDPRSTYLSTETMVVIDSEEFTAHLTAEIENDVQYGSLRVEEDYTYVDSLYVQAEEVSFFKSALIRGLSWVTRYFEYML